MSERDPSMIALRTARAHLHSILSDPEIALILDALNGCVHDSQTWQMVWASVEDAIRLDGLDDKWGMDGPALVDRLRQLDVIAACALVRAAERWWARVGAGEDVQPADALAQDDMP